MHSKEHTLKHATCNFVSPLAFRLFISFFGIICCLDPERLVVGPPIDSLNTTDRACVLLVPFEAVFHKSLINSYQFYII